MTRKQEQADVEPILEETPGVEATADDEDLMEEEEVFEDMEPLPDLAEVTAQKLAETEARLQESKDQLLRIAAEYDNYRKRTTREKEDLARYASGAVIEKLLPVLDTMERAILFNEKTEALDALREGMVKVHRLFWEILEKEGLEPIANQGEPFDVNLHMAVMQEPAEGIPDQTVTQVFEKGYRLKDRVLRHAKVKVAQEN